MLLLDVSLPEMAVAVTDADVLFVRARAEPVAQALAHLGAMLSLAPLASLDAKVAQADARRPRRRNIVTLDRLRLRAGTLLLSLRWAGPPLPMCVSFSGVPLTVSTIDLAKPMLEQSHLRKELLASLVADALVRAPAMLGSSELLGNPTAAVQSISEALAAAIEAPFSELAHLRSSSRQGSFLQSMLLPLLAVGSISRGVFTGIVAISASTAYAATSSIGSIARAVGENIGGETSDPRALNPVTSHRLPDHCFANERDSAMQLLSPVIITSHDPGTYDMPESFVLRALLQPLGAVLRGVSDISSAVASSIKDDDERVNLSSALYLEMVLGHAG